MPSAYAVHITTVLYRGQLRTPCLNMVLFSFSFFSAFLFIYFTCTPTTSMKPDHLLSYIHAYTCYCIASRNMFESSPSVIESDICSKMHRTNTNLLEFDAYTNYPICSGSGRRPEASMVRRASWGTTRERWRKACLDDIDDC